MNNFIRSLEQKIGRFAVKNLTVYMIVLYITGYFLQLLAGNVLDAYFSLDIYQITRGQIWRVVSWLFMPPERLGIFTIFMLLLYYMLGTSLERVWGSFRYNLFIFSGIIFTIIGAVIVYIIMAVMVSRVGSISSDVALSAFSRNAGLYYSTYYINTSIFLAYASIFPNEKLYFYFLIPIKIKWLAALELATMLVYFIRGNLITRITLIAALLNVALYIVANIEAKKSGGVNVNKVKRKKSDYIKIVNSTAVEYKHKCAVCGRTDVSNPELEFRYCSKCNGVYEYCNDHLFTHEHIK